MSDRQSELPCFNGAGEVRSLLRVHDWSTSPLGHPHTWAQQLTTVVNLLLDSSFPMFVAWGPDLGFLYNDAYAQIMGNKHPSALGRRFQDVWGEIWSDISPIVVNALAGKSTYFEDLPLLVLRKGYMENAWFTFSYSPVEGESGKVAGMYCTVIETTNRVFIEKRQAFQLQLVDRLRRLSAPDDMTAATSAMLGEQLNASRVLYAEVNDAHGSFVIRHDWTQDGLASVAGEVRRLDDFGPEIIAALRAGDAVAIDDIALDARTAKYADAYGAIAIRAYIASPIMQDGVFTAIFSVHQTQPYRWTDQDITLVSDTVERTWLAVEHAHADHQRKRAEDELRRSVAQRGLQLQVADLLRNFTDLDEIYSRTSELLGRFFRISRVLYGEYDRVHKTVTYHSNYTDGTVTELHGRYPVSSFGAHNFASLEDGTTWICNDLSQDPRTADADTWPMFESLGIHAAVVVPFSRQGMLIGCLFLNDSKRRDWSAEEVSLINDIAERIWNAIERFRSDKEKKLAEENLMQADRRKDEFLAMLAHELRNPLAPIGAAAELLQFMKLDEARVRQTSQIIGRQVEHMTNLVDDLLDVSRVTRGLVELDSAPLDIRHIVTDAVEQVTPLIRSRRHHLALHLPPQVTMVMGDKKRLIQVIANLLNNATKYTPEGGNIVLKMEVNDERLVLEIIDDGIGMAPQLVAHVFELFAQAERTPDRSSGGLGLGLALVKSLVELHGGTVTCVSEGIGKGSRFTVLLPRLLADDSHFDQQQATNHQLHATSSLRILVVDDNIDAAATLSGLLEASGHQVLVEHDSRRALERARLETPDVCLLDIGLPDMDGNELAQHLRRQPETANSMLIAITGYGQENDQKRSYAAGFDHYFVKPVDTKRLAAILHGIGRHA